MGFVVIRCDTCDGVGILPWVDHTGRQHVEECTTCGGSGGVRLEEGNTDG